MNDPAGRVSACDWENGTWQLANDPQPPQPLLNDGGTIWPPLGDTLVPLLNVPIGFVNVAVGASSRQWLPGEALYDSLVKGGLVKGGLVKGGRAARRFRAVLWQQGESDVIENVKRDVYVEHLLKIRAESAKAWGWQPTWLLAKSTMHPTVYNLPEREERIRAAIDRLWREPGFAPGPDADILAGENRGPKGTRQHFSGIGQRRAATLWFAAIWAYMQAADKIVSPSN